MKIYCPLCSWAPGPYDRWVCLSECGMVWNTFETNGKCPRCRRRWTETCCLACVRWSPHEDWYHDDDETAADEDAERRERPERRPVHVPRQPAEVT